MTYGSPTNAQRAEWAQQALDTFIAATGADESDALSDLLANLHHWCDRNNTNFANELRRGRGHYLEELSDDV